jgi:hypothetical protein
VQYQSRSIIAMIVSREQSGIYGSLLNTQRTSCSKPKGSPWSSPLRSDGSQDDQAGEAGPVELKLSGGQESQTKGQETVYLPLQWDSSRGSQMGGGGPVGWIKGLLSRHVHSKKESWKASLSLTRKGYKAARQNKAPWIKKKELLTQDSGWAKQGTRLHGKEFLS